MLTVEKMRKNNINKGDIGFDRGALFTRVGDGNLNSVYEIYTNAIVTPTLGNGTNVESLSTSAKKEAHEELRKLRILRYKNPLKPVYISEQEKYKLNILEFIEQHLTKEFDEANFIEVVSVTLAVELLHNHKWFDLVVGITGTAQVVLRNARTLHLGFKDIHDKLLTLIDISGISGITKSMVISDLISSKAEMFENPKTVLSVQSETISDKIKKIGDTVEGDRRGSCEYYSAVFKLMLSI